MPMLALVKNSCSPAWNGALKQASSLLAMALASLGLCKPGSRMMNSSPPRRATVSTSRTCSFRRWAMPLSSRSPTGWPRLSLMCLKRSRSRNSTAPLRLDTCEQVSAACRRFSNRARLGRPVSGSWWAW
ncbi:hypothetical protein D3C81_898210 [compost metagenome]